MTSKTFPIHIVDAFTSEPFSGNPAAVCLIPANSLSDEQMQKVGSEMNLSETAFIIPDKGQDFVSGEEFSLRWFTPTTEVNLCGHATLASAAVLVNVVGNKSKEISFHTLSGILKVKSGDRPGFFSMQFPLNKPSPVNRDFFKKLLQVVIGDESLIQETLFSPTTKKLVVRLKDDVHRHFLESLNVPTNLMVEAETSGKVRGMGITLKGSEDNGCVSSSGEMYDFVSRYFAPWVGIPEDPVTGSWHTVLTPYWAEILSKRELYARQLSRRGGDLRVKKMEENVSLNGQAVVTLRGTFEL